MLTRSSQVGEFYVMSPPQVQPASPQFSCDMMIYDEESDRHVRIQWKDAMQACLIAAGDADYPGQNGGVPTAKKIEGEKDGNGVNTLTAGQWKAQAILWANYNESTSSDTAYPPTGASRDIRIVVARPFIEHLMVRRSPLVARLRV